MCDVFTLEWQARFSSYFRCVIWTYVVWARHRYVTLKIPKLRSSYADSFLAAGHLTHNDCEFFEQFSSENRRCEKQQNKPLTWIANAHAAQIYLSTICVRSLRLLRSANIIWTRIHLDHNVFDWSWKKNAEISYLSRIISNSIGKSVFWFQSILVLNRSLTHHRFWRVNVTNLFPLHNCFFLRQFKKERIGWRTHWSVGIEIVNCIWNCLVTINFVKFLVWKNKKSVWSKTS